MVDVFRTSVLFSRERLLLLILAMVQLTNVLDFVVMMPLGPQFMRYFSISPQAFGMMVSSYTFSAAIFGFLGAFFIDRFDRRVALLVLYAGFTLGTFCCALAPTYELLTLARSLAGAFGGIIGAVVMAIVGDAFPEARRGAATGVIMSSFSIASIAGVPFGLYLAHLLSWQAPFFMLAALSAVTWLGAFCLLPPLTRHLQCAVLASPIDEIRLVLSLPNTLRAFAFMSTLMLAGFSVIPFISPYMVGNVGLSESDLPYIYLFGGFATFFTSRYIGVLSDRYGKKTYLSGGRILFGCTNFASNNFAKGPYLSCASSYHSFHGFDFWSVCTCCCAGYFERGIASSWQFHELDCFGAKAFFRFGFISCWISDWQRSWSSPDQLLGCWRLCKSDDFALHLSG